MAAEDIKHHRLPSSDSAGILAQGQMLPYARRDSAVPSSISDQSDAGLGNDAAAQQTLIELDDTGFEDWEKGIDDRDPFVWKSARGWFNVGGIAVLLGGIIAVFLGLPVYQAVRRRQTFAITGFNLGGINGTGQIPNAPMLRGLIDPDTPSDVYSRIGFDGREWPLVFSDEFETDGRTFYPGDDPFFEAVDLHYWVTADFQWYHPSAVRTEDGHLIMRITEEDINGLHFKSGMVQSWNKLCFYGSMYIEVSLLLPGNHEIGGFWPGVWTMGNLGRPGYGATTDGTWPYSYDSCDIGTLPNQTYLDGSGPAAALRNRWGADALSYLPGQRWSACTCPGEDHPGPRTNVGRGSPEVDIIEAQIRIADKIGEVSQTLQLAPYNENWEFDNSTSTVYDPSITYGNSYFGGQYQQSASRLTDTPRSNYAATGGQFAKYAFEMYANPDDRDGGYITWTADDVPSWSLPASGMKADPATEVSQRPIPEEPMSLIFNLGMSDGFQAVDFRGLTFPNEFRIDYIRVYQREDFGSVGCNPKDRPTTDYIERHKDIYNNRNLTTWDLTGLPIPRSSLRDGGC